MSDTFHLLQAEQGMFAGLFLIGILRGAVIVFCGMCAVELISREDGKGLVFLAAAIGLFAHALYTGAIALPSIY